MKICYIVLFHFIFCNLSAQTADSIDLSSGFLLSEMIRGQGGPVIVKVNRRAQPTELILEALDEELQTTAERRLSLVQDSMLIEVEGVFDWNDRLNVLTSTYFRDQGRYLLVLHQFAYPDLRKISTTLIHEPFIPPTAVAPFDYAVSPDSSKLLVATWAYALATDPLRMEVAVFDARMNRVRDDRILLPYTNERAYVAGVEVGNDASFSMMLENYTGKISEWSNMSVTKVDHFLLAFGENSSEPVQYDLTLPEKHVPMQYSLTTDPMGRVVVSGFYRKRSRLDWAGAFWMQIDPATQRSRQRIFPAERDAFLASYGGPRAELEPPRHRLKDYQLQHLFTDAAGNTHLLAERSFVQAESPFQMYIEPEQYSHVQDVLIYRIDPTGELLHQTRLPKDQRSRLLFDRLLSYQPMEYDGKLYLLYNDVPHNYRDRLNLKEIKTYEGENSLPVLAEVDARGDFRFILLNGISHPDLVTRPGLSLDLRGGRMLFYEEDPLLSHRYQLGLINIRSFYAQ